MLRNKKTGEVVDGYVIVAIKSENDPSIIMHDNTVGSVAKLNEKWEDYEPEGPKIEDEATREIIKKWYNQNGIVGKIRSYGGRYWIGLRGTDKAGTDWKIELFVGHKSLLEDDKLYSLTELCGEEEE